YLRSATSIEHVHGTDALEFVYPAERVGRCLQERCVHQRVDAFRMQRFEQDLFDSVPSQIDIVVPRLLAAGRGTVGIETDDPRDAAAFFEKADQISTQE